MGVSFERRLTGWEHRDAIAAAAGLARQSGLYAGGPDSDAVVFPTVQPPEIPRPPEPDVTQRPAPPGKVAVAATKPSSDQHDDAPGDDRPDKDDDAASPGSLALATRAAQRDADAVVQAGGGGAASLSGPGGLGTATLLIRFENAPADLTVRSTVTGHLELGATDFGTNSPFGGF